MQLCLTFDTYSLPPEVMNIVLEYCEQADCLAVLHTCRSYHEIAVPHVYRKIVINTPRQLRSFIATGQQAEFDGESSKQEPLPGLLAVAEPYLCRSDRSAVLPHSLFHLPRQEWLLSSIFYED